MKSKIISISLSVASMLNLSAQKQPNVVFILADDLGYGDLSCFGQDKFETPNIDKLALTGMRLTGTYAGAPVSAPSRTSLMTGFHTGNTPIRGNRELKPEGQIPLPKETFTVFDLFKSAGYTTGAFGKWGLGQPGSEGDPNNQGVDEFFGYNCQNLAHNYYPSHLWHNQKKISFPENDEGAFGLYSQDLIHEHALEFIRNNKDNPFFLYVPTVVPHAELVVPEDSIIQHFRGKFPEKPYKGTDSGRGFRKGRYMSQEYPNATYAAMVTRLDIYVGQIIEELKSLGIYDNTMIVFTSDNGPHREGGNDPDFFNSNSIFRGYKRDLYEGGIRVPTIVSWPGNIPDGTQSNFAYAFWDYLPTFAEITGQQIPHEIDGVSVLPTLLDKGKQKEHDYFYFEFMESGGTQAVIMGNWKLIHLRVRQKASYELYNLASDPGENHNLIELYPEKFKELKEIMLKARTENKHWKLFKAN